MCDEHKKHNHTHDECDEHDCKCGDGVCGCDDECDCEDDDIVTLFNEETQKEEDFYTVAVIDNEGKDYIFLAPVAPSEDIGEDEVIICELGEDAEGFETILPVEDDELLQKVYDKYVAEYEKEFGPDAK